MKGDLIMRRKENRHSVRVTLSRVTHNLMVLYADHTGLPYSRICDKALRDLLEKKRTIDVPEGPRSNGSKQLGTNKKSGLYYIDEDRYKDVVNIVKKMKPKYPQLTISLIFEQALSDYLNKHQ